MRILAIIFCLVASSCTRYYLVTSPEPVEVYPNPIYSYYDYIIPGSSQFILTDRGHRFASVKYGDRTGYIVRRRFVNAIGYRKSEIANLQYDSQLGYYVYRSPYKSSSRSRSSTTSVYSSRASSYKTTSRGGPVHVRGYYRKNGTYVSPHTRSAPTRSGGHGHK